METFVLHRYEARGLLHFSLTPSKAAVWVWRPASVVYFPRQHPPLPTTRQASTALMTSARLVPREFWVMELTDAESIQTKKLLHFGHEAATCLHFIFQSLYSTQFWWWFTLLLGICNLSHILIRCLFTISKCVASSWTGGVRDVLAK